MSAFVKNIFQNYPLFAVPTFLNGMASCFDLHGTLNTYRYSANSEDADRMEIKADWIAVGLDMKDSMRKYEESNVKAA